MKRIVIIIFALITAILNMLLKNNPLFIERYYSNSINMKTRETLSLISGIIPFSVGEILVILLLIALMYLIVDLIIKIIKKEFINGILNIAAYVSVLYILFMFLWGFNYNRLSFDKISGLKLESSSKEELYSLCEDLIIKTNSIRERVKEDSDGISINNSNYEKFFNNAIKGYEKASVSLKELGGRYGKPKPIFFSKAMCYTGITGIYIPYTGEPNVNVNIEKFMIPCTISHEMAHQRGFAREDEANYIAYLTCTINPDIEFQYSGYMLALIHSMNALYKEDKALADKLKNMYSEKVKRDIKYQNNFWAKYSGNIEKISNNINDSYLKSNGEKHGTESYGKMVDLLLAERRKLKNIDKTPKAYNINILNFKKINIWETI